MKSVGSLRVGAEPVVVWDSAEDEGTAAVGPATAISVVNLTGGALWANLSSLHCPGDRLRVLARERVIFNASGKLGKLILVSDEVGCEAAWGIMARSIYAQ